MDGMRNLNVTNNEELKAKIFDMEESLQDERQFKDFYVFVFPFAKTKTQKSMDVEMALALWEIVLKDRYAHVPLFIDFIRKQEPIKVVNKDQWTSFLDFCKVISVDLSNFDPLSSCK
ncbi:potentiating neddylation domain-containing protein [Umbelopsis sp. AD052]|nr:potentiating neddylation domain-containing protein [Umbelopsis sp. AD052]